MDVAYAERFERIPMSRAEFDQLPEKVRAEYVDGVALVTPPARGDHNGVGLELAIVLRQAFPDAIVRYDRGVELPTGTLRIPDVAVQIVRDDEAWSPNLPVLVVEILSRSTRSEDLFRKTDDYRRSGIQQYWIVDRAARTLAVLVNAGEHWDIGLSLTDDSPTGSIEVADLGGVELDLTALLA
ncbi:Uma2 family endonuclease [Nocardioides carbamazepini]|uniref:Uma2 family endonuclease n=1 Tax=Nocardioides carbamazepini TaxID=2854259 RepID=UPI00214A57EF|nr:Uma2 family endonuclease [Nocardioides carbamazepini]MCR1785086.1 Uma2 family endonuclease [Nocardioides carbamazepini]